MTPRVACMLGGCDHEDGAGDDGSSCVLRAGAGGDRLRGERLRAAGTRALRRRSTARSSSRWWCSPPSGRPAAASSSSASARSAPSPSASCSWPSPRPRSPRPRSWRRPSSTRSPSSAPRSSAWAPASPRARSTPTPRSSSPRAARARSWPSTRRWGSASRSRPCWPAPPWPAAPGWPCPSSSSSRTWRSSSRSSARTCPSPRSRGGARSRPIGDACAQALPGDRLSLRRQPSPSTATGPCLHLTEERGLDVAAAGLALAAFWAALTVGRFAVAALVLHVPPAPRAARARRAHGGGLPARPAVHDAAQGRARSTPSAASAARRSFPSRWASPAGASRRTGPGCPRRCTRRSARGSAWAPSRPASCAPSLDLGTIYRLAALPPAVAAFLALRAIAIPEPRERGERLRA